ncbi:hypothetical protein YC2023_084386 [Brassica napus]
MRTVPSSKPVSIIGSSGWKDTADTLCMSPPPIHYNFKDEEPKVHNNIKVRRSHSQ